MAVSTPIAALLDAGELDRATAELSAAVRTDPTDSAARSLLAELLCLSGAFERAEAQLALLAQQTTDRPIAIARMRHLVRAAVAREAWFNDAAVPALLKEPTVPQRVAIALALALREGSGEAAALLAEAEARRPKLQGMADGAGFDDIRDADDRSAWFFEVLTHDGGYIWVDLDTVAALRFVPPKRPIDLLWREARLTLRDGREADIAVPAQYVDPAAQPAHRLAQRTDWHDVAGGAVVGTGQRIFLAGEEPRGLLDVTEIVFAT